MSRHRVLITGVGGNVGQGVLKSLRAARLKFEIIGLDMNPLSAGFSLCDRYALVPRTSAPDFKDTLIKICREEKPEAVFVCSPTELLFFSEHQAELKETLKLTSLVNSLEAVRMGSDKFLTVEFLRKSGFAFPETALLKDEAGAASVVRKCGFPLIVKPRFGFSSEHVYTVNSSDEIKTLQTLLPDAVLQEKLHGPEYTSGTVSGNDKKVRAVILLHRELLQGTTYRTELLMDTEVEKQVAAITESFGAIGPCNLQFKIKDGRVVVFEINPRFSGTSGIRHLYGFNDCEMSFELLHLGLEPAKPVLKPAVVLRYWNEMVILDSDFSRLREGQPHRGKPVMIKEAKP